MREMTCFRGAIFFLCVCVALAMARGQSPTVAKDHWEIAAFGAKADGTDRRYRRNPENPGCGGQAGWRGHNSFGKVSGGRESEDSTSACHWSGPTRPRSTSSR